MITFGTNGFRATLGEEFTKQNVQKIAQGLSKIIKSTKSTKPVIIGYDRRFMSSHFAEWFSEVLAGNDIKVKLSSIATPTPAVMYEVRKLGCDYGVIITASHNPYFFNGVKICVAEGKDAPVEFTEKLEVLANKVVRIKTLDYKTATQKKLIETYNNTKDYVANLDKFVSKNLKNQPIKVLFNAMNGVTSEVAQEFVKHYHLENVDIINTSYDPYFNFASPCPNEENLVEFRKQVVKGRYKIGFACDGDGDRLGIIDEKGEFISTNYVMAIIYYYLVKYRNMSGDIVKSMPTSTILDKLAEKFGYKCHECPVGIKWVSKEMQRTDALLGGESSGGLTVRNYTPTKDSIFAVSLLMDAVTTINKPISAILQEVKKFAGHISTFIESTLEVKNKKRFLNELNKNTPNFSYKPTRVSSVDGKKYYFEDGSWVQIRLSGTENVLRYYVEFSTEIECERNIKAIQTFVNNINKKCK